MSELLKINVNEHTEKKGSLTYLSWAWAWAEVLKHDPGADWVAHEWTHEHGHGTTVPCMYLPDGSALVKVTVTIKGKPKTCLLPVMDNRNNAVKNPDARKISDAIMRCMTKAIAMHGLGLYIYAGEDLPEGDEPTQPAPLVSSIEQQLKASIEMAKAAKESHSPTLLAWNSLQPEIQADFRKAAAHVEQAMPDCAKAIDLIEMALNNWPEEGRQELKAGFWYLLDSKTRSAIKRHTQISALTKEPA